MKEIRAYTYLCVFFVGLLFLSGSTDGMISRGLYYLAFVLPIALGLRLSPSFKRQREEMAGAKEESLRLFSIDGRTVAFTLPLILPTVLLTILVSSLWGGLLTLAGLTPPEITPTSLLRDIGESALIPSVLEEIMFRALPMLLIFPCSKKRCLVISSLYFALAHASVFSFPYAFAAGLSLAYAAICTGSIIPCIIIHFVNNLFSVLFMHYSDSSVFCIWAIRLLGLGALVSAIFIARRRREYIGRLKQMLSDRGREELPSSFYLFVILTTVISLSLIL